MENRLSGITLSGFKRFQEYLLNNASIRSFEYDLPQFERELKNEAFRENDANKIMHFLRGISNVFGLTKLELTTRKKHPITEEKDTLFTSASSNKYPNVYGEIDLSFMSYPHTVINLLGVSIFSHHIYINPEEFAQSTAYKAWEKALQDINENVRNSLYSKDNDKISLENISYDSLPHSKQKKFRSLVRIESKDCSRSFSLDEIIANTQNVCEAVQKSYLVTKNLPQLYNEEIKRLSERLQQMTPQ